MESETMCVLVILILYRESLALTFFWLNHFSLFLQAGDDEEGLGIDYEYTQALSELRIDLSNEE